MPRRASRALVITSYSIHYTKLYDRFKGLGEISPSEFGQFIGEDIRLLSVDVQSLKSVPEVLTFYMGKNTPERREFIMKT